MAVFGNASTLRLGQYGIVCNVFLILILIYEEKNKTIPTTICYVLAAIKPNYSGLFFINLFIKKKILSIIIGTSILLLMSILTGCIVNTNPLEMIGQMIHQSSSVMHGGTSLINLLIDYGAPDKITATLLGAFGIILTTILMFIWRSAPSVYIYSIAAVIGRLTTYHRHYDNVMLIFPLISIGVLMFEKPNWKRILFFIIFAMSVWLPIRYINYTHSTQIVLSIIWVAGLITILRSSTPRLPHEIVTSAPPQAQVGTA